MSHRILYSALLIFGLAGVSQAGVIVDSASRSIGVSVNGIPGIVIPDPDTSTAGLYDKLLNVAPTVDDFGSARLLSNFGTTTFSGLGTANTTTFDGSYGESRAAVDLTFTLDQAYFYQLVGELNVGVDFGPPSSARVLLGFGSLGSMSTTALNTFGSTPINQSGSLGPGTYQLSAFANSLGAIDGTAFIETSFDFTLSLQQANNTVPEPSTLSMFALMLGAGLKRRRCR